MGMGYNLYRSLESEGKVLRGSIGVRINSQYGVGAIEATSTAAPTSKFGVPIKDTDYNELLGLFAKWPEVNGLHSHVGSQGIDLSSMVNGVKFILDLADRLNRDLHRKQITILDIGGGLPVDYKSDCSNHMPLRYAEQLRDKVPLLFSGEFTVITENGRWVVATSGWFVSRVEYTKIAGGVLVGITHAGGNMFVREVYMPSTWSHPISVYDRDGGKKRDNVRTASIAGPLCFSGDLIAKEVPLPAFEQGDFVVYHHTAAYSISMYSIYNCISAPPAYFYSVNADNGEVDVCCIKRKRSVSEVSGFWDE